MDSDFAGLAQKRRRRKGVLHEHDLLDLNREAGRGYLIELPGWTVSEYFEYAPEDRICEYQDGKVIVVPPASTEHQDITLFLTRLLASHVEDKDLGRTFNGPATVKVGDAFFEPDLFFVGKDKERFIRSDYIDCPPDLAVEILSPSTRSRDLSAKLATYQQARTPEVWIVDPDNRELRVWRLTPEGYVSMSRSQGTLDSAAVPGFRIDVSWLWQRPLPRVASLARLSD